MRTIKNKLSSQRGASLTFALLIFLVCAVVGSAVLVAGTAASGRMSKIAEMDQRYYSVNSAARLLIDLITENEVQVVKTVKKDGTSAYTVKTVKEGSSAYVVPTAPTFTSLTEEAAYQVAKEITSSKTREITLKGKSDSLSVKIIETINPDGSLLFELVNDEEGASEKYRMQIWFAADKKQMRELDYSGNTETVTTTLKWKLSDVEIVRSKPPVTPTATPAATPGV